MQQQLKQRLQELKAEFERGQKGLAEADAKAKDLRDTLLRISGAIQVLEEELSKEGSTSTETTTLHSGTSKPSKSGNGS